MPLKYTLFIFFIFSSYCLNAQTFKVSGTVVDTSSNLKIENVSVSILAAKDSFLIADKRTLKNGYFEFTHIDSGKYVLMLTYPEYADYTMFFTVPANGANTIDLGEIPLTQKTLLLETVIIKSQVSAIKLKGDSTEYIADSFKVQKNASVEDLLRQLPGIQVDQFGKITAQGKTVNKVFVDGEEFFSDDPTLVTRNLRADMIDKVQLYDKKSDKAVFTGIDDGIKNETINLTLKEDKKNGYFGKLDAGVGTDNYYNAQGIFNKFADKRKFSAYLTTANTGLTGLNYSDQSNLSSDQDANSDIYNGEGLPSVTSGGTHFDDNWDSSKQSINGNYNFFSANIKGANDNISQQNLPGKIIFSKDHNSFYNSSLNQKGNSEYDLKTDSSTSIKVGANGRWVTGNKESTDTAVQTRQDYSLLNTSANNSSSKFNTGHFNVFGNWEKQLKKKGRTVSVYLSAVTDYSNSNGFLNSQNKFYDSLSRQDSVISVNQLKKNSTTKNEFDASVDYTEPLAKNFSLIAQYQTAISKNNSNKESFNQSGNGSYKNFDSTYSNHFVLNNFSQTGSLSFNFSKKKMVLNFGNDVEFKNMSQKNLYDQSILNRNFTNWSPHTNLRYNFTQYKSLEFNYTGNTTQPSISQLQPVLNNSNPLYIVVGNSLLTPSFTNGFTANYSNYKVTSAAYLYLWGSYSNESNAIVSSIVTDTAGRSISQFVNLKGRNNNNYNAAVTYDKMFKKLPGINFSGNLNFSSNQYVNYVDNKVNNTTANAYRLFIGANKTEVNKYTFIINAGVNYNTNQSSLQRQFSNNFWSYNLNTSANYYLPAKFELHTDINYNWQQKTQAFIDNYHRLIWNAWIGKKFFSNENLLLKISGNDILNQNIGLSRSNANGIIAQNRFNTIGRYFMLSGVWDFKKFGKLKN
ncbi:MAG: outer membrane beta-barrel protein [Ginsengibacter sp.]